jgi:NAD(P)-dependent dehydrogenase (short-subunit alcohol dehydrogenase family)
MRLEGRVALVTGTSPNIGGGIAEGLAAAGASVACVDLDLRNAADCANAIRRAGGRAIGVPCDVSDRTAVDALVDQVARELGRVDLLVNNAAIFLQKGILGMELDEWRRQLAVMLDGTFLCTRRIAKDLVAAGAEGSIVNVISTAGHQGQPGNVGYCTAKAGLLNFTRSVAMELAKHRIRVNSLTPTATDPTDSFDRAERWGRARPSEEWTELFEPFRKGVPMQRLPTPADYAKAVVFLSSDDAQFITGTDLKVDAGALSRYWAWNPETTS